MPVLQVVSAPAATARVVASPAVPQVAAPKRVLQVSLAREAVLMVAVLPVPALPLTEMLAAMGANSAEGTVSTRPEEPHATEPPVAVASTSAQQLDCSERRRGGVGGTR